MHSAPTSVGKLCICTPSSPADNNAQCSLDVNDFLQPTLGSWLRNLMVSVTISKKDCCQFGAVDCLIGWRLFYLSFAQAGREGEKSVQIRMVVNDHLTSQIRIRVVEPRSDSPTVFFDINPT
jgi:hypothetical protein